MGLHTRQLPRYPLDASRAPVNVSLQSAQGDAQNWLRRPQLYSCAVPEATELRGAPYRAPSSPPETPMAMYSSLQSFLTCSARRTLFSHHSLPPSMMMSPGSMYSFIALIVASTGLPAFTSMMTRLQRTRLCTRAGTCARAPLSIDRTSEGVAALPGGLCCCRSESIHSTSGYKQKESAFEPTAMRSVAAT